MKLFLGSILALATIAPAAFSADFSSADSLYAKRGEGAAAIATARNAYNAMLGSVSGKDLVYTVEQISRLEYYEGSMLPESDTAHRKVIFQRCMDTLDARLAPATVGKTPQFYYWKATCLANWAKANGILSSLGRSQELVDTLNAGLAVESRYEGGGFDRVLCTVYQRLPSFNPFGPTYDLAKAATHCERAMKSQAYPGALNPDTATGDYFFLIYGYTAELREAQNRHNDAVALVTEALDRINGGDIAPDREPETMMEKKTLEETLGQLGR